MSWTVNLHVDVSEEIPVHSLMGAPQKMTHGAGFRRCRCGWKGISIALIIHSLDRTYRVGGDGDFLPILWDLVKGFASETPPILDEIP